MWKKFRTEGEDRKEEGQKMDEMLKKRKIQIVYI